MVSFAGHSKHGPMDLQAFVRARGGVVRTRDLARAGFDRDALGRAVRNGLLHRIKRGVYAVAEPDAGVAAAMAANGVLTCVSAAPHYGLWTLGHADGLHLSCGNGLPRIGVVDHTQCRYPRHPVLPMAGPADVVLHALRCRPELEALVMAQSAIGQAYVTPAFLRSGLPGNRNGRARAVLDLVVPRADSLLEVLAHTHFVRAGFHVQMHVWIEGVGEVDCLVDGCLVVELDGRTHFEPKQIKKDQRRNNASIVGGFLALRYYYDDVVHRPEAMVQEVRSVLTQRNRGTFSPTELRALAALTSFRWPSG